MGFSKRDLELVLDLASRGYVLPSRGIVELGAQQINNSLLQSPELINRAAEIFQGPRNYVPPSPLEGKEGHLSPDAPYSRDFWTCLGFRYCCIDVDGSPHSVPLDLNFDLVPATLNHQFGLVTNYGTSEHICNQLNIFKAAHDLVDLDGVMIHHLPAGGNMSHGFFNYNFKFFWMLARSNDYEWLYAQFNGGRDLGLIPKDIIDVSAEYQPGECQFLQGLQVRDDSIMIALRKRTQMKFVPPLDVNTGSTTNDDTVRSRYWTVYQPELIDRVRSASPKRENASKSEAVLFPVDAHFKK